jgi:type VI secretion system protein ImpC
MTETFALADVEGELVATLEQLDARPSDDVPFRVLLIGDWSGRRNRGLSASSEELKAWRPLLVDHDNLDQLIARLGVKLHIPLTSDGSQSLTITFNQLDDFHPDRLFSQLEVDKRIAGSMKAILHHPDFQAIESAWRALDFLVTRLDTGTELKLYLLDISFDEFKADLHSHEDFRSTAIYNLAVEQTIGTSGGIPWAVIVGNFIFDFVSEPRAGRGPQAGSPLGVGVATGPIVAESELIKIISLIAEEAGAPFIAGTTSHLLGCESLAATPDPDDWRLPLASEVEERWKNLTSFPSADYVGLALPRFLLRLPYGKETDPTEEFDFEELSADDNISARHESYLWANPAFAVAYLLAKGFSKNGWEFRPSDALEIEGLPLHIFERNGESEIKPCAEALLTVRAAKEIIDSGFMPLLSMKDSDTIRLGMFQSIAGTRLRGRWDY